MSLTKSNLEIAEPCNADWTAMTGSARKRFCNACTKNVHDLSELSEAEALKLVESQTDLCVRYTHLADGTVRFADTPRRSRPSLEAPAKRAASASAITPKQLARQRSGARALMAGAALAIVVGGGVGGQSTSTAHADVGNPALIGGVVNDPWLRAAIERSDNDEEATLVAQNRPEEPNIAGGLRYVPSPEPQDEVKDPVPTECDETSSSTAPPEATEPPEYMIMGDIAYEPPAKPQRTEEEEDEQIDCSTAVEPDAGDCLEPGAIESPPRIVMGRFVNSGDH